MRPHSDLRDDCHHLCLRCGFCCDGTIFKKVQLEERDAAAKLPLFQITCEEEGFFFFHQPCIAFDQIKGCRIYGARPVKCRKFSCKLLSLLRNQELPLQQALDLTERTRRLKNAFYEEVRKHHIDKKFLINTRVLVDHIESKLPSRDTKINYGDVYMRCADFSAYLHKYFIKDRSPE